MQRVMVEQRYSLSVERVYAYVSEHENLGPLLGATITRVRDGDTSRNGAGSVRQLKIGPLPPFEETVTDTIENERIDYRITKGSPLKGHHASMVFSSLGSGSQLVWTIEFGSAVPGLDRLVKLGLTRSISSGLKDVERKA